jgi:phage FluMu gp28-like protein
MSIDAALPDVFLPYQQRFMDACFRHPVVVVEKSRRTGFSWAAGAVAALKAAATRGAAGSDVFYIGYNLEMAREFIDYVAEWARAIEPAAAAVAEVFFNDPDHPERDIRAFRVTFASGFKVVALPSVPRALRGMQGLVIIDEAAFHEALDELLKAAFALLIWGGRVVVISTHNGDTNPFNVLVADIRAGRKPYALQRTTFDEALADGLYRRICLTTGRPWTEAAEAAWRQKIIGIYGDGAEEELFVVPSPSTGSYLPAPLIEARMQGGIPVLRWACPPSFAEWPEHLRRAEAQTWCEAELLPLLQRLEPATPHCFGEDFARHGDLTVIWPLAIGRDLVRRTPFVVELRGVPFRQQEQVLFYLADRLPRLLAGALDATGNGAYLAEVAAQRYGLRINQVAMSEAWYRDAMPPFKAAFEDAMIVVPRDRDILADLRALTVVRGVARIAERSRAGTGEQRHGDAAIAACLAYAASRSDAAPIEFTPVGAGRPTGGGVMADYLGAA